MAKSVSFDVIGTCFSFDSAIQAITDCLGPRLSELSIDPKTLCYQWFYSAQRDFTYASICGAYLPIAQVLRATFKRACFIVDLPQTHVSDADVTAVMAAFRQLPPRPGLKTCIDGLRAAGWDVYGVTNGGVEASLAYFHNADITIDEAHLLSCDAIQVAKPDARVYEAANTHLSARSLGEDGQEQRWFVAAHAWDLLAARKAGFRTAYLSFEEHDPVTEVFGEFDVYAESMEELLVKMGQV